LGRNGDRQLAFPVLCCHARTAPCGQVLGSGKCVVCRHGAVCQHQVPLLSEVHLSLLQAWTQPSQGKPRATLVHVRGFQQVHPVFVLWLERSRLERSSKGW